MVQFLCPEEEIEQKTTSLSLNKVSRVSVGAFCKHAGCFLESVLLQLN